MADPFLAEIRIFGFNFPPRGWALCNGQRLPISQNTALFSLIGTYYGGDGKTTFGLPNLQGAAVMQPGQGSGLSERTVGDTGGRETVTLVQSEMPAHGHSLMAATTAANSRNPSGGSLARSGGGNVYLPPAGTTAVNMSSAAIAPAGGSLPHNNMQPYLTLNFCIAMQGIYPQRS